MRGIVICRANVGCEALALAGALALGTLTGCQGQTSDEPPVLLERNMYDQERYNPESYSQFFTDHRTMRSPVEGTVARDRYEDDPEIAVLRVDVTEGDYWEASSSKLVMGVKYVAAAVTRGKVEVGEAGHVRI